MRKHRAKVGRQLRARRLELGLTLRQVHNASIVIVQELQQRAFEIPPSRLYDIEMKDVSPNIYRLYVLARVYRLSIFEILSWYGIPSLPNRGGRRR